MKSTLKLLLNLILLIIINSCSSLSGTFFRDKIIVDMDIPQIHDDGVALSILEKSKKVSIEKLTISADQKQLPFSLKNLGKVKSAIGRNDYITESNAVSAMVDTLKEYPGEVVIVCFGPLTNLASLIKKHKSLVPNIKEVIISGGVLFKEGKINKTSEYNFWKDPESANIVLKSGVKITLFGFDVASTVYLDNELFDEIRQARSKLSLFLTHELGSGKNGFYSQKKSMHINSSIIAVYMITENLITNSKKYQLKVIEGKNKDRGKLVIDDKGPLIDLVLGIDEEIFYRNYFHEITKEVELL